MAQQRAEVGGLSEFAAAFRASSHIEPTSRHVVSRVVRGGKAPIIRSIKIVEFNGQAILLGAPNSDA
jgi:hypothetical protein